MELRETKREKTFRETRKRQKGQIKMIKLKTRKGKVTRKLKIIRRIKLKPLKRHGGRLLPYPVKKRMKKKIKPLSAHPNSLSKILETPVPNKVIEIKIMCSLLSMHILISPKEKDAIEKKFEDILEKMIQIYSTLEMKPFRVKNLDKFKAEFEEIKRSKLKSQMQSKLSKSLSKPLSKSFKSSKSKSFNKSKKLFNLVKNYIGKSKNIKSRNIKRDKSKSNINKSRGRDQIVYGGRVVELEGDWDEYPPLQTMTYMNCVASSYRILNLLDADEADEIGNETVHGLSEKATIKWLNKIYGEQHYLCRFWTCGQVIDEEYMEELDDFFENLLPYANTGTMVSIEGHYFNVVRNELSELMFYDLQARWMFENDDDGPKQYYWIIRHQDFYQFFLSNSPSVGTKRGPIIEVICQDYTRANFLPTQQTNVERRHEGRYAIETLKQTRIEEGNSPHYYEEYENYENYDENQNYDENYDENQNYDEYWDNNWEKNYNQWYKYSKSELLSIINGRTRIPFSESKKENASRFFNYRYGWDGITRDFNENEDNRYNYNEELVYLAPEYHNEPPEESYTFRGTPLMRAAEITHDRYNFDLYDSECDIGRYGQVDNPTRLDIEYNYDTLWTLCSYAKNIRFWINSLMFGKNNINSDSYSVNGLKLLLSFYQAKIDTLTEHITLLGVAIEDYSSPIYRDKIGIGHANVFYKIQKILQKTINLLYTFMTNIKVSINRKTGRREYQINQKNVNRGKIQQLFVKEATISEFRKVTGDDRGCRFIKKNDGFHMFEGGSIVGGSIVGGSGMERALLQQTRKERKAIKAALKKERRETKLRQGNGAGAYEDGGLDRGAANRPRPKERKRKMKEIQKGNDISITINCALDPTCPNQRACIDYIESEYFERRLICEPRENLEEIVRVMRQGYLQGTRLIIIRAVLQLIELFEFTDLPALTILLYIHAPPEQRDDFVDEKFWGPQFYSKAIEYIFTEEFFDKAMDEEIDWEQFPEFSINDADWDKFPELLNPELTAEEIEVIKMEIVQNIRYRMDDMKENKNSDYVIIEEVYGEYSGGYLSSLIPIYISETIIQKPLMSDGTRAAVSAFLEGNEYYTEEYIEKIRIHSWPIDEAGFRKRTGASMYEHYAYEDEELY